MTPEEIAEIKWLANEIRIHGESNVIVYRHRNGVPNGLYALASIPKMLEHIDSQDNEIKRLEGLPRAGLYGKYMIQKADGSPVDPKADYFVLRLDTDPAARRAALEYSYLIREDRELALDLQRRIAVHEKGDDVLVLEYHGPDAGILLAQRTLECVELKGEIKRLEDALVEERARRSVAAGAECFFRTPIKGSILSKCDKGIYCDWTTCPIKEEKKQDAREQLRDEGVIR